MIRGTLKHTAGGTVIEVDYHETRRATVGATESLSLLAGVNVETEHGIYRVERIGRDFRVGQSRRVYLYVTPATSTDDIASAVAAKIEQKNNERFAARQAAPATIGDHFTPNGWNS